MSREQLVAIKYSLEYTIAKWKELGMRVDGNFTSALKEVKEELETRRVK